MTKFYVSCYAIAFFLLANLQGFSQCTPTPFSINQAPVVTGTPGAVNTTYRRANILPGVDIVMQIASLNNGATLGAEDDLTTETGVYLNAWQPTVVPSTSLNGDGGITWNISFFVNGTSTPYRFNCLSVLAVDIDGNGTGIREYVEAANPYSYTGQGSGTFLTYSSATNNLRTTATATTTITNIDSTAKQAMVLYRFVNITGFTYTTGYTKTTGNTTRQFSLFFSTGTSFPSQFTRYYNTDNDGVTGLNSATDTDDDGDGIPDASEYPGTYADPLIDTDADGTPNYQDASITLGVPTFVDANSDGINDNYDIDLDGIVNSLDLDSDNDGIPDLVEAGGIDSNGDGIVDVTTDTDGDGLANTYDTNNAGVNIANLDTDGDAVPNFRDLDSDNDGIPDVQEAGATDANNDGRRDSFLDIDSDGLADAVDGNVSNDATIENTAGALIITSAVGGTAGRPASYPRANADANGLPNPYDLDSDGDGILDIREAGITDATDNGIVDDLLALGADGWSDAADALGSIAPPNTDGTGRANYLDIDSDDDGISDNVEGQSSTGYAAPGGSDSDGDGIDNVYDNNDIGFGGFAGNGLAPVNTDGTDQPDYTDTNSDNDAASDRVEGNDWNGNGIPDETITLTGVDTDSDGLDDQFDLVTGPDVTTVGYGGTGGRSTVQQTPGAAPNRDWRNGAFVLPVTLISFGAEERNGIAYIRWIAETEINFRGYTIERSLNARDFSPIGTQAPLGGGNRYSYQFTDDLQTVSATVIYYRLKMTDIDGRVEYSAVASVSLDGALRKAVSVNPNPVTENMQIRISSDISTTAEIRIIAATGQVLFQAREAVNKGDNILPVRTLSSRFAKGTYILHVTLGKDVLSTVFVY